MNAVFLFHIIPCRESDSSFVLRKCLYKEINSRVFKIPCSPFVCNYLYYFIWSELHKNSDAESLYIYHNDIYCDFCGILCEACKGCMYKHYADGIHVSFPALFSELSFMPMKTMNLL